MDEREDEHRAKRRKLDAPTFSADGFVVKKDKKSIIRVNSPRVISEFQSTRLEGPSAPSSAATRRPDHQKATTMTSTSKKYHPLRVVSEFESNDDSPMSALPLGDGALVSKPTAKAHISAVARLNSPPQGEEPPPFHARLLSLKPPNVPFQEEEPRHSAINLVTPRKLTAAIPDMFSPKVEIRTPTSKSILTAPTIKPEPSTSGDVSVVRNRHVSDAPSLREPSVIPDGSSKELRTISHTRLALATNVDTAAGQAEVMSISVQQERMDGHRHVSALETELMSGLVTSPEKGERVRGQRYLRGGLAERAQGLLTRSQTSFSLWQRELSALVRVRTDPPSVSCARTPDLRVYINDILELIYPTEHHTSRSTATSNAKTGATLLSRPGPAPRTALLKVERPTGAVGRPEIMLVLLTFAPASSSTAHISSAQYLEKGRALLLWEPWQEMDLANVEDDPLCLGRTSGSSSGKVPDEELYDFEAEVLARPNRRRRRALLCSRFLVVFKPGE